jgi:NADPH:quinone reductase-like Zn-dependent oxidoreductase
VYPNGIEPVPKPRRTFRVRSFDAVADAEEFAKLNRRFTAGRVRVPIGAAYPLARAAQAHRRLDRGHVLGRLLLQIHRR